MKKTLKIRLMAMLLCMVMLFSVACAPTGTEPTTPPSLDNGESSTPDNNGTSTPGGGEPTYPENGTEKIVPKTVELYVTSENVDEILVAHYESTPEILLMDIDNIREEFLDSLLSTQASFSYEETETTLTIKRENGAYCVLDFVEDTLYFNNLDLFKARRSDSMSDLLAHPYVDSEGNSIYFSKTDSWDISGLSVYIDLASRNIPLDIYEGKKYIPLQTFNDVFLSSYGYNFVYNSKALFMATAGELDPSVLAEYYSIEPTDRSEALAEYTVNELCLLLDLFYGLQDEHGVIVGFDVFLEHAGILDDLRSTNPVESSTALASFMFGYLADRHSVLQLSSPYTGSASGVDTSKIKFAPSFKNNLVYTEEITSARAQIMSEGVPGYQEIGNTAYVTFDEFTISPIRFEGYSEESKALVDTMGLIIYAHSMITRENSPIENVVLDLSCNTGGAFDSAVYVVSWMLGYCDFNLTNPVTGSFSTSSYWVDVNLDGVFDAKDSISDKNLYCIVSPVSFSCGNLVPALLKESGKVTIIGDTSGGGTCVVQFSSAADGSIFTISGSKRFSVVANGAYYTVDRGVEPHVHLGKFESYFNREALTDFINNLK